MTARPLEQTLADWLEDAQVARRLGHEHDAELIERFAREVKAAAEDQLTWLSEAQVVVRSGCSARWWRARFPELAADGHARLREGRREYRQVAIPRRIREVRSHG